MIFVTSENLHIDVYMRADTDECLQRENMRTPVPIPQAVYASPCGKQLAGVRPEVEM